LLPLPRLRIALFEKFLAEFGRRLQYRTEVVLPLAVE
jgi:hypothetical protein